MAQQELNSGAKQPQSSISKNDKALEQTSNYQILRHIFYLRRVIFFMCLNFENKICVYGKFVFFTKVIRDGI